MPKLTVLRRDPSQYLTHYNPKSDTQELRSRRESAQGHKWEQHADRVASRPGRMLADGELPAQHPAPGTDEPGARHIAAHVGDREGWILKV